MSLASVPASEYRRRVTIIEAANLLGLDPSTIRWQIRKGKIKAKKVGRDWQVTRREVERYRVEHLRE